MKVKSIKMDNKYQKTGNRVYLNVIYDLIYNKIISYEISISNTNKLIFNIFHKLVKIIPKPKYYSQSDRVYKYSSSQFEYILEQRKMTNRV